MFFSKYTLSRVDICKNLNIMMGKFFLLIFLQGGQFPWVVAVSDVTRLSLLVSGNQTNGATELGLVSNDRKFDVDLISYIIF